MLYIVLYSYAQTLKYIYGESNGELDLLGVFEGLLKVAERGKSCRAVRERQVVLPVQPDLPACQLMSTRQLIPMVDVCQIVNLSWESGS